MKRTVGPNENESRWAVYENGALVVECDSESEAHLIAAAPDLLAAAEATLFRLQVLCMAGVTERFDTDPLVHLLRTVIHKAKGPA